MCGVGRPAEKQVTLESLPPVLAVQVKRFVFMDGKPQKLHRRVRFDRRLVLPCNGAPLSPPQG